MASRSHLIYSCTEQAMHFDALLSFTQIGLQCHLKQPRIIYSAAQYIYKIALSGSFLRHLNKHLLRTM